MYYSRQQSPRKIVDFTGYHVRGTLNERLNEDGSDSIVNEKRGCWRES